MSLRGYGSGGFTEQRSFDAAQRLSGLHHDFQGSSNDLSLAFAYNPASQIRERSSSNGAFAFAGLTSGSTPSAANGLNQLTTHGSATLGYDPNGNMTSDGATTFAYDAENRLITATGAKNATLRYDPMGRLFEVASGGSSNRFLYDGDALVLEYDSAVTLLRGHLHGGGIDDPVATFTGSAVGLANRLYQVKDHQGSVIGLVRGDTGALEAINRYDEYGVPQSGNQGRFQYTGQAWIPELGLYYYKARFYNAAMGRFMQVDPVGYEAGTNIYAYSLNDPINFVDPDGRTPVPATQMAWALVPEPVKDALMVAADFVPVLGDIKGTVETINDPSTANIIGSVVGLAPGLGDVVGAGIKNADNIADIARLNAKLAKEELDSVFTSSGELTEDVVSQSFKIMDSSDLSNGTLPQGFSKYSTPTYKSPSSEFQVHFYKNDKTGEVYYGQDYKSKFNEEMKKK